MRRSPTRETWPTSAIRSKPERWTAAPEVVDRRLARAQSRYIHALTALAKVRKLITPVVIGQLNVSENAVNVAEQQVVANNG